MNRIFTILMPLLLLGSSVLAQNPVCQFQYKKAITINGAQVTGGPHTDFPMLISHTDADLATAAGKVTSASGFDIIFADDSGNPLDFQLEHYNGATGEYVAWVKIPSITNGTDVTIHMLYGKASITTDQSTNNVWSDNFEGVWTLHNDFLDKTGNGFNGTNNGSTDLSPGHNMADGQDFDGANDNVAVPNIPNVKSASTYTISTWINPDNFSVNDGIFANISTVTDAMGIALGGGGLGATNDIVHYVANGATTYGHTSSAPLVAGNWYHVVAVFDGSQASNATRCLLYLDGVAQALTFAGTIPATSSPNALGFEMGRLPGNNAFCFDSQMDHATVSTVARSANYVATEYASHNQPTTTVGVITAGDFYSVATEEDIYHTSAGNGDWDQTAVWDSGLVPDGQFENVEIQHDVDIDAGSADYTVCDCYINSNGAQFTILDISSTRTLDVRGELNIDFTGATANGVELELNNTATINVAYDMNWTRSNTDGGVDLDLDMNDDCTLDVTGDWNITHTAGDDVTMDLEENSDIDIGGDVNWQQNGGDELRTRLDDGSTFDVTGNMNLTLTSGDDIFFDVNMTTITTGSVITVNGDLNITQDGGDDFIYDSNDAADFNVLGNVLLTQNGGDELRFNIDGNSRVDVTGNLTIDQNGGDDVFMYVNNTAGTGAQLNIGGNVVITHDGGDDIEFICDDVNSVIAVTGDITATGNGTVDTEIIDFNVDGGTFTADDVTLTRMGDHGLIDIDLDGGDITWASLTINSSGTLFDDGAVTIDIDNNSVMTVNGLVDVNMTGADDFRIRVDDAASGTASQFICAGNLDINRTDGDDIELSVREASSLIHVQGSLIVNTSGGEEFLAYLEDGGDIDIDVDFNYTHSDGEFDEIEILAGSTGSTFNVDGNMTVNLTGGTGNNDFVLDINDGTLQVDGNVTMTLNTANTDQDFTTMLDNAGVWNIGGALTATQTNGDDMTFDLGNNTAGSTAQLNVGTNASFSQNIGTAGHSIRIYVFDDTRFTVGGNLNLTSGNTASDIFLMHINNTGRATVTGDIDFDAQGSGDLEIRIDNTGELQIGGDFDRTPSAFGELDCAATATLEFNGTTGAQVFPQDAGGGGDIFDYGIVEINNSFGTSPQITMEAGVATVHTSLVLMDGIVSSGAANLLVVDAGATATGASDDTHVDGLMRKVGNDDFEFPVGDLGVWAPIEIENLTASVNFDAEYFFVEHADPSVLAPLAYRSHEEYWTLDPSAAVTADLTLHWKDANRSGINTFTADLVIAHYDGTDWESYGQTGMTAADPGDITVTGVSTFSPFTFGSLSSDIFTNPLPIELLSFDATLEGEVVQLDWVTATELDNDYFTVERSIDGQSFDAILTQPGAGTSQSTLYYNDVDPNPVNGWNYYRLRQTDFDGSSTYSDIRPVFVADPDDIVLFPNPTSDGGFTLQLGTNTGASQVTILDALGRRVLDQPLNGPQFQLVPGHLAPGSYLVRIVSGAEVWSHKLVVR